MPDSETGNETVRALLYTDTAEYHEAIGEIRYVSDWVDDSHRVLETFSVNRMRARLSDLPLMCDKFRAACSKLLGNLDPAIYEQEYVQIKTEMRVVRDKVDDLKIRLEEIKPHQFESPRTSTPLKENKSMILDTPVSKLPDLPIPRFDGRPDGWISFIDQFDSVVDNQPTLTPTLKLHYLVGALSDEPRRLIQHLKIEAGNYTVARDLLKRRYHNLRVLADTHIAQIMMLPNISPKLSGLRVSFLNPLLSTYRCLERLDLPVNHWSYLLVHLCLAKLPSELKSRFERRFGDDPNKLPTFDHLITFLEDECRHHDNVGSASVVDTTASLGTSTTRFPKSNARSPPPTRTYVTFAPTPKCHVCNSASHYVRECPEFVHLPTRQRVNVVKEARLCYRCLDKHSISQCKRDYRCNTCRRSSHHTLLCYADDAPVKYYQRDRSYRDVAALPSNSPRTSPPRDLKERSSPRTRVYNSPPPRNPHRASPPRSGGRFSPVPNGDRVYHAPPPRTQDERAFHPKPNNSRF